VEILTNIIVEYLKHNKRLCVPKLGTFIVKQSSGAIIFSDLMRGDDGVLRSLLMEAGMRELEANGAIDRFVFEVRHAITVSGKMKIEGLGEFSADINNTISFTPAPRQKIFGGNIKPPVEVIQERIPPREAKPQRRAVHTTTEAPTKQTSKRKQQTEDDGLTLGKPDAYLRGLKYDSRKNKKREESGHGKRVHGGGRGWIVMLLFIAILAGGAYLLWPQPKSIVVTPHPDPVTIIESDSTGVDTLPAIDSLTTPEILEETLPTTTIVTPTEVINE
jgi:nucleoid DNA-binding protein